MLNGTDPLPDWLAHEPLLMRVVREIVPRADVADVLQCTWLALLSGPAPSGRARRAWLVRVARNFAYEHLRAEANRRARELESTPSVDEFDPLQAELGARVLRELGALEEPYRRSLKLRFLEQRTYAEIAAEVGVAETAVRKRVERGLRRIRRRLDGGTGFGAAGLAAWWSRVLARIGRRSTGSARGLSQLGWGALAACLLLVPGLLRQTEDSSSSAAAPRGPQPAGDAQAIAMFGHLDTQRSVVDRRAVLGTPSPDESAARDESEVPHLRGRLLGPRGLPFTGEALRLRSTGQAVPVDAAGRFDLLARPEDLALGERWVAAYSSLAADAPWARAAMEHLLVIAPRTRVEGVVRDARGSPLAEVTVRASLAAAFDLETDLSCTVPWSGATTRTDADGRYTLSGLPAQRAELRFQHPGFPPLERAIGAALAGDSDPLARRLDVRLRASPRVAAAPLLEGIVLGSAGEPLPGARVHADERVAVADREGRYRLELPESTEAVRVSVAARGCATTVEEVQYDVAEHNVPRDWKLERARRIAGRALGPTGRPWAGALVVPWGEPWLHEGLGATDLAQPLGDTVDFFGLGRRAVARTGPDGEFELAGFARGSHRLALVDPSLALVHVCDPVLVEDADVELEVRVPADPWRVLRGRVVDGAGRPRAGVAVMLALQVSNHGSVDCWRSLGTAALTDADGTFVFEGVPRACRAKLLRLEPPRQYAPVLVEAGGDQWVELAAERLRYFRVELARPPADVVGARVLDAQGRPLPVTLAHQSRSIEVGPGFDVVAGTSRVLATTARAVTVRIECDPPVELPAVLAEQGVTVVRG